MKLPPSFKLRLSVLLWCFVSVICATAQVIVTGTVFDSTGETLPSASVRLKGNPNVAVVTNIDGRFEIKVPDLKASLLISFIGYKEQTVALNGRSNVEVTLQDDSEMLEDVVVVGYGMQKKVSVTGSVSAVSGADLVKAPMTNVSNLLTGKVSGITAVQTNGRPGEDGASIKVRGVNDFANSGPLILVDGVKMDMNLVNPNDIESVSILKDASAAIYGVEGANGVILITTKKGQEGIANISYSGTFSWVHNTALPEFCDAEEYIYWHNKARIMDGEAPYYDADILRRVKEAAPDDYLGNTNWFKEIFRTGFTQQHNVSATGGGKNTSYFVSGGVMDQQGTMRGTNYRRYNVRSNLEMKVAKNMRFASTIAAYRTEKDYPNVDMSEQSVYNPSAEAVYMLPIFQKEYQGIPVGYGMAGKNPVAAIEKSGFQRTYANRFVGTALLEYDFKAVHPVLDGLKVSVWGSYNTWHQNAEAYFGAIELFCVKMSDIKNGTIMYKPSYAQGESNTSYSKSSTWDYTAMLRPQVSYNHTFGKAEIGALYLYEATKYFTSSIGASARNYIAPEPVDLGLGLEIIPTSVSGSHGRIAKASHIGRLNFAWDDKYLFEFAFRYDGSYKFAPENRWGFFPSVSAGWIMSSEPFIKNNLPWIDHLKLRASYGESGKDNLTAFLYEYLYNSRKDGYIFPSGTSIPLIWTDSYTQSRNLKWSSTKTYNFGVDIDVLRRKLGLELDVFYQVTSDLLESIGGTFPSSLGGNTPKYENSGAVDNRGIDFTIKHELTVNKDFSYRLRGTFGFARNKVLRKKINDDHPSWRNTLGYAMGARFGLIATGLAQTQEQIDNAPAAPSGDIKLGDILYMDTNGDGKIMYKGSESDYVRIGYGALPEITFSMNMDFNYKDFYLNMLWQGVTHVDYQLNGIWGTGHCDHTPFTRPFYSDGNAPKYLVEDSWTPENTDARYPRLSSTARQNNAVASTWWLINGEYLRLKNLTLGYNVPEKILKHTPFSRFNIYVSGTNVLTFSHFKWLDPESPSIAAGYYPQPATWSLGLNVNF